MIKKILTLLTVSTIMLSAVIGITSEKAFADIKVDSIVTELNKINTSEKKLKRLSRSLSSTQRQLVVNKAGTRFTDSDADGVPDEIENNIDHTNVCNGSEHQGGEDSNSKGLIASVASPNFTVGSVVWVTDSNTIFKKGTVADLIVGACVEVEGHVIANSSDQAAVKVAFKKASDCSGN